MDGDSKKINLGNKPFWYQAMLWIHAKDSIVHTQQVEFGTKHAYQETRQGSQPSGVDAAGVGKRHTSAGATIGVAAG
jgi:hypothetical protein